MLAIQSSLPRCTIANTASLLIITIPGRTHWFLVLYLVFIQALWIGLGILLSALLIAQMMVWLGGGGPDDAIAGAMLLCGAGLFLVVLLGAWLLGILYILYAFVWQLAKVEKLTVDSRSITAQPLLFNRFPLGRPKTHLAEHVKNLRTAPTNTLWWWAKSVRAWTFVDGSIVFDDGAKTFRYGDGVDEAEARDIVQAIQERFPQYER